MSLRDRLEKKKLPESIITVLDERFLVKGLKRSKRSEVFASCRKADGKMDNPKTEGVFMSLCVCDAETGEPVYTEAEWQKWDELPAGITGPLVAEIMRLNGMDDEDVGREVKNSDSTDKSV